MRREVRMRARDAALRALQKVDRGEHVQAALARVLEASPMAEAEKQQCADLVYGCLRERIRLRHILSKALEKPAGLPPRLLAILEMGAYGLIGQKGVPAYAAINESVNCAKRYFGKRMAGLANAALRSIAAFGQALDDPLWHADGNSPQERWKALCVFYGIPAPIADLWKNAYGKEIAIALMKRSSRRPWSGLRLNVSSKNARLLEKELASLPYAKKICESGFAFPPGKSPQRLLGRPLAFWLDKGDLTMQAAGSMLLLEKLGIAEWRKPIWDCCAGAGGKSEWMLERGLNLQVASDVSLKRLQRLKTRSPLFPKMPFILRADAAKPPFSAWNGHILADVPCSGLGVLARRPDIRQNLPNGFQDFADIQKKILWAACSILRPGNELAYATCSLNPAENEKMIANLLVERPDMELVKNWQTSHAHPWLEGMYGAILKKQ